MATNLNLKKSLNTFSGRFESIPVDAIEFTLRPPIDTRLLSFNVTEVTPCWLYSYWSLLDHGGAGGRFWQVGIKHWGDPYQPSLAHHAKNIVLHAIIASCILGFHAIGYHWD